MLLSIGNSPGHCSGRVVVLWKFAEAFAQGVVDAFSLCNFGKHFAVQFGATFGSKTGQFQYSGSSYNFGATLDIRPVNSNIPAGDTLCLVNYFCKLFLLIFFSLLHVCVFAHSHVAAPFSLPGSKGDSFGVTRALGARAQDIILHRIDHPCCEVFVRKSLLCVSTWQ